MSKPDILTLAAISGSSADYGVIPTIPAGGVLYVRCPCGDSVEKLLWAIKCNKVHAYQLYLAERILTGSLATLTLSGWLNTETINIMGNVYTGITATTTWSTRSLSIAGSDTADTLLLAKAITGGRLITHTTADATADTVSVTGIDGIVYTYTGAASADLATRVFDGDSGVAATIATSLAAGINHKGYFTCATSIVGDHVVVGGITYTAKAGAADLATHKFSIDTGNNETATSLTACINADTATHGFTAVAASAVVTLTRTTAAAAVATVTGHATTVVYTPAYGVPGVVATTGVAELLIGWETPTGGTPPVVTTSNATAAAVTTIGDTYLYATAAAAVVTLKHRAAYVDLIEGDVPFVFQATTGTAAGHCAVVLSFLTSLYKDGAAVASIADNSTTAGTVYSQTINGWAQAYIAVTNSDATDAATMVVKANRLRYRS